MKILIFLFFFLILLGGYDKEEKAARAYDLAALKYWGPTTTTNFPVTTVSQIPACTLFCFCLILLKKKISLTLGF